jgi:hypothetical protein
MTNIKFKFRFIWDLGWKNPIVFLIRITNEIENRANSWDVSVKDQKGYGSLSNTPSYLKVCGDALNSDEIFESFRSCRSYRKILEHVSPRTGEKYLRHLEVNGVPLEALKSLIPEVNKGGPATYYFNTLGKLSPTSIRYAKVHGDIRDLFGDLTNVQVLEIGCGYGGLAVQLLKGESLQAFYIADLEAVEKLAMKYISNVVPERKNLVHRARDYNLEEIDLLISNYAFSELTKSLQDEYIEKYIQRSKKGYLIYNHINPPEFGSYSAKEFCQLVPGAEILEENPLTDRANVLIVWGHKLK